MTPQSSNPASNSSTNSSTNTGALAGLRVVDLSRVLAGPLCTQMLADHGADVVKIESPDGDETRSLGPPFVSAGEAAYFQGINRGKRAIALDLAQPAAREVLLRMLEHADVLIENFLPGTMERWGLAFESVLAPRFPRLVYCTISGFGVDGPLGGLPGYDAIAQAMGGPMSITGTPESGPLRSGVPMVDIVTGYNAFSGILLAITERARSGRGQRVEATLYDTALTLLIPHATNWMYSGKASELAGNSHVSVYPYDRFNVEGRHMFLGVVNQGQFVKLCRFLQRPELLDDARFHSNGDRVVNKAALREEIERSFAGRDVDTLCAQLMASGVPAGPVNAVPEAFAHPHTAHRAMDVRIDDYRGVGVPVKLARTPGAARSKPPRFAQHSVEVLTQLGYAADEIASLQASGALPAERRKPKPKS